MLSLPQIVQTSTSFAENMPASKNHAMAGSAPGSAQPVSNNNQQLAAEREKMRAARKAKLQEQETSKNTAPVEPKASPASSQGSTQSERERMRADAKAARARSQELSEQSRQSPTVYGQNSPTATSVNQSDAVVPAFNTEPPPSAEIQARRTEKEIFFRGKFPELFKDGGSQSSKKLPKLKLKKKKPLGDVASAQP